MKKLAEKHPREAIDYLSERLAFERSGVKLYDRILEVMRSSEDSAIQPMLDEMAQYRDEELEHVQWLEEQISLLGGDILAQTDKSELVTRESEGIEKVVMSDAQLPHLFHALLTAELADNAGWDLLAALADEASDREAKRAFKQRLHEEEEHLIFVRKAVERFSVREVLGIEVRFPGSALGA